MGAERQPQPQDLKRTQDSDASEALQDQVNQAIAVGMPLRIQGANSKGVSGP
jgi:glycolate oxidase FAD binding subunit